MIRIVVATRNPAKVEHYRDIFAKVIGRVLGLTDLGVEGKPSETGETAEENAELKAKYYCQKTGMPVFCEDEALYVDFLPADQQPGTKVRRIDGVDESDDDRLLNHWEKIVAGVSEKERTGYWHTAYCLATTDGRMKTVALNHPVRFFYPSSKVRIPGWPMSSLQGPVRFGKPHSELTDEERKISRREMDRMILAKLKELLC